MIANTIKTLLGLDYLVVFPSGWEARPWDNIYRLKSVEIEQGRLLVDLSDGWLLSVQENSEFFSIGKNFFILVNDAKLSLPTRKEAFPRGVVCFIEPSIKEQMKTYEIYKVLNDYILGSSC